MDNFQVHHTKTEDGVLLYFITIGGSMVEEATRYLQHKSLQRRSPNTVREIAYAVSFYLTYLMSVGLSVEQVLQMKYTDQYRHFSGYLTWLKDGNHSRRGIPPQNQTCNQYLREIWGFLRFCVEEYGLPGEIKVLESRMTSRIGVAGVRHTREAEVYSGYLPAETEKFRNITGEDIHKLIEACTNSRNRVLIRLLSESGFRIGEILGIRYGKDINVDECKVKVVFREDNDNNARAKRGENRSAVISRDLMDEILFYISENRKLLAKSDYLFVALAGKAKGQPLNVDAVYSVFRKLKEKTGIAATPHMLRHYFADERRKAGWRLEDIQYALGHKDISTTIRYLHPTDEELGEKSRIFFENSEKHYDIDKLS